LNDLVAWNVYLTVSVRNSIQLYMINILFYYNIKFILELLMKTQIAKKSHITEIRKKNIHWVVGLNREKLIFEENEVILNFHRTQAGEIVGIKYPGKESNSSNTKVFKYDFRPKVLLSDGNYIKDLTFFEIWDALLKNIPNTDESRALLGVIFYRMAYMIDYINHEPLSVKTDNDFNYSGFPEKGYLGICFQSLKPYLGDWAFNSKWAGMSFEAFVYYNDLLALNEDVKYWYRAENFALDSKTGKPKGWKADSVGRVNTMLTHLNVIGYHSGKINFAALIEKFSRGKGVCPVLKKEAILICEPFLIP